MDSKVISKASKIGGEDHGQMDIHGQHDDFLGFRLFFKNKKIMLTLNKSKGKVVPVFN
jgi:hypothetical protein